MNDKMLHEQAEPFGPANPHPAYGKDPNVVNEFGHTKYPRYVTLKDGGRVIVESEEAEAELELAEEVAPVRTGKPPKGGWPAKT